MPNVIQSILEKALRGTRAQGTEVVTALAMPYVEAELQTKAFNVLKDNPICLELVSCIQKKRWGAKHSPPSLGYLGLSWSVGIRVLQI